MDAATRRNLEIETTSTARSEFSLVGLMDRCATPMGSRLLRHWINRPIRDRGTLRQRQQAIETMIHGGSAESLQSTLRDMGDMERILTRVGLRSARPRDLAQLRHALRELPGVTARIARLDSPRLDALVQGCGEHDAQLELLDRAIVIEPPVTLKDGGVIAAGYDTRLDELRTISADASQYLDDFEQRERERTGLTQSPGGLQPRPRLLHRNQQGPGPAGARQLRAAPDAEGQRALHRRGTQGVRGQDPELQGTRAGAGALALRRGAGGAQRTSARTAADRGMRRGDRCTGQPGGSGGGAGPEQGPS